LPVVVLITYKLMVACLKEESAFIILKALLNWLSAPCANATDEARRQQKKSNFFKMIIFVQRFKSKDSDELLCIHFENLHRNSLITIIYTNN